jgi:peptidyl-dipeptidase A
MHSLRTFISRLAFLGVFVMTATSARADEQATARARQFLTEHEAKVQPLEHVAALAWWNANITGKDEDFEAKKAAQNRVDQALADRERFAQVKKIHDEGGIDDPVLKRAIDVIYLAYLEKQVDPALLKRIVDQANEVEKKFNNYRAQVDGKEMTDSEVRKVLKESKDSERRQAVWEASKGVGKAIESDLKTLVKLRNQAARELGFKNFHALQLFLNEQNGDNLIKLFDDLDDMTREPFTQAKAEIDAKLAADCSIPVADLRPWHYQDPFFQEAPFISKSDPDEPYRSANIIDLTREFYQSIGLPVDGVVPRSDLFERKGKSPHAFCTDIDREGGCPRAGEYRAQPVLDGDDAPRVRAFGLQQQEHSQITPVHAEARVAYSHDRRRGHDVRAQCQAAELAGGDARTCRRQVGIPGSRSQDDAEPASNLFPLVPGDAPVREGNVRESGPGP